MPPRFRRFDAVPAGFRGGRSMQGRQRGRRLALRAAQPPRKPFPAGLPGGGAADGSRSLCLPAGVSGEEGEEPVVVPEKKIEPRDGIA